MSAAKLLQSACYINIDTRFRLRQAVAFGFFVFAFLYILRPFGIGAMGSALLPATIGFGAVTFFLMLLLNVVAPAIFRNFFNEERWTLGKEFFYTMLNIWLIGLCNFAYYNYFFTGTFYLPSLLWFQFSTLSIGVFPVSFFILLRERYSRERYSGEAKALSTNLLKAPPQKSGRTDKLIIHSQNQNEDVEISADQLLYMQAADNYVEVFFRDKGLQKRLVRNSLKVLDQEIGDPNFFRCHKSFLVNLGQVERISGNAQGYKLHLKEVEEPVPVSRQFNESIRQRLSG